MNGRLPRRKNGGSIGGELCLQIARFKLGQLLVLSLVLPALAG
ncbi:MAG: hypothetical protein ABIL11_07250 [Chloroflexota bacterium]